MMSLIARLCALCACASLMQMMLEEDAQAGVKLTGGLLMLHLVVTGARDVMAQAMQAESLAGMLQTLIR